MHAMFHPICYCLSLIFLPSLLLLRGRQPLRRYYYYVVPGPSVDTNFNSFT